MIILVPVPKGNEYASITSYILSASLLFYISCLCRSPIIFSQYTYCVSIPAALHAIVLETPRVCSPSSYACVSSSVIRHLAKYFDQPPIRLQNPYILYVQLPPLQAAFPMSLYYLSLANNAVSPDTVWHSVARGQLPKSSS